MTRKSNIMRNKSIELVQWICVAFRKLCLRCHTLCVAAVENQSHAAIAEQTQFAPLKAWHIPPVFGLLY